MFFDKKDAANDISSAASWWRRVDSNHRSQRQQIYSLPPLATRELLHTHLFIKAVGAGGRTRTPDLLITNQLLYQLSYTSTLNISSVTIPFSPPFVNTLFAPFSAGIFSAACFFRMYKADISLACQTMHIFSQYFFHG